VPDFVYHDIHRLSADDVLKRLESSGSGLSPSETQRRLLPVSVPWMYMRSSTRSCGISASVFSYDEPRRSSPVLGIDAGTETSSPMRR